MAQDAGNDGWVEVPVGQIGDGSVQTQAQSQAPQSPIATPEQQPDTTKPQTPVVGGVDGAGQALNAESAWQEVPPGSVPGAGSIADLHKEKPIELSDMDFFAISQGNSPGIVSYMMKKFDPNYSKKVAGGDALTYLLGKIGRPDDDDLVSLVPTKVKSASSIVPPPGVPVGWSPGSSDDKLELKYRNSGSEWRPTGIYIDPKNPHPDLELSYSIMRDLGPVAGMMTAEAVSGAAATAVAAGTASGPLSPAVLPIVMGLEAGLGWSAGKNLQKIVGHKLGTYEPQPDENWIKEMPGEIKEGITNKFIGEVMSFVMSGLIRKLWRGGEITDPITGKTIVENAPGVESIIKKTSNLDEVSADFIKENPFTWEQRAKAIANDIKENKEAIENIQTLKAQIIERRDKAASVMDRKIQEISSREAKAKASYEESLGSIKEREMAAKATLANARAQAIDDFELRGARVVDTHRDMAENILQTTAERKQEHVAFVDEIMSGSIGKTEVKPWEPVKFTDVRSGDVSEAPASLVDEVKGILEKSNVIPTGNAEMDRAGYDVYNRSGVYPKKVVDTLKSFYDRIKPGADLDSTTQKFFDIDNLMKASRNNEAMSIFNTLSNKDKVAFSDGAWRTAVTQKEPITIAELHNMSKVISSMADENIVQSSIGGFAGAKGAATKNDAGKVLTAVSQKIKSYLYSEDVIPVLAEENRRVSAAIKASNQMEETVVNKGIDYLEKVFINKPGRGQYQDVVNSAVEAYSAKVSPMGKEYLNTIKIRAAERQLLMNKLERDEAALASAILKEKAHLKAAHKETMLGFAGEEQAARDAFKAQKRTASNRLALIESIAKTKKEDTKAKMAILKALDKSADFVDDGVVKGQIRAMAWRMGLIPSATSTVVSAGLIAGTSKNLARLVVQKNAREAVIEQILSGEMPYGYKGYSGTKGMAAFMSDLDSLAKGDMKCSATFERIFNALKYNQAEMGGEYKKGFVPGSWFLTKRAWQTAKGYIGKVAMDEFRQMGIDQANGMYDGQRLNPDEHMVVYGTPQQNAQQQQARQQVGK